MLQSLINQADAAVRLLEQAQQLVSQTRGLRSGDRVYTPLIASAIFEQGSTVAANLVFNVPADTDFWAYRFMLYPYCRVVDPVNGTPDEVVFRSTTFTSQPYSPGQVTGTSFSDAESQVDANVAFIVNGKEIQNSDVPAAALYCTTMDKWGANTNNPNPGWCGCTQTPAGQVFDVPQFIPRSKTLTVRLTPTYLGVRTAIESILPGPIDIIRRHQYKFVGVLEGERRVNAFR